MKTLYQTQKGFTLVELAIVMTIIGLLIGGILKGQELMLNARVTATIAQVRSYEAAATTFRDSYASLPGDMVAAATRLPGCTANCNPGTGAGVGGNSIIGLTTWAAAWGTTGQLAEPAATTAQRETTLFWMHLLLADLISGVSSEGLATAAADAQWGLTHPQARINGGFVVGYADGTANVPNSSTSTTRPSGMVLAIVNAPTGVLTTTAGVQPMQAAKAAQIDRKMDDGRPASGFVHAYGTAHATNPVCVNITAAAAPVYDEDSTGNECGIVFRIQG